MGDFNHAQLDADFGYTWCHACGGNWEGPEDPSNSPCSKEAQAIRDVRGHFSFLFNSHRYTEAASYLEVAKKDRPLAFEKDGLNLKEVYWNSDGSTI